ncbi:MAG: RNA 2',3'-cyclic phosphodiesterase [Candidatus Edwardsbacteria bacterium]|jgi:2'-5' RNA ligase|nr:RNA 2',3'-cyclic phosphodiesterase [Candidatus Edwardsbacteria bacterium]
MPAAPSLRCFIALEIPADIRTYLGRLIDRLRASGADVKWVEPDGIHLTLKFLGPVDPGRIAALASRLDGITATDRPVTATLGPLGAFPDLRRPQVIWCGLAITDDAADILWHEVEQGMAAEGFAPERRGFTPHLTLGRVRTMHRIAACIGLVEHTAIVPQPFVSDRLSLVRSDLTPLGPVYHTVHTIQLGR